MRTPKEVADELLNNAFFTEDQANTIADDIYQPICEEIEALKKTVLRLTACLAVELGTETAKSIIAEIEA